MSTPTQVPGGEVLLYEAPDGQVRVDVRLDHETVWLTQEQMGRLFGRERSVITKHIRNVFREGELEPEATCAKFAQVQIEGERTVTREIDHYNLDVIISVGYRVKSAQGTRFRQWATRVLREHLIPSTRPGWPSVACWKRGRRWTCWHAHCKTMRWWTTPAAPCWN